jgi:hypothetical protein
VTAPAASATQPDHRRAATADARDRPERALTRRWPGGAARHGAGAALPAAEAGQLRRPALLGGRRRRTTRRPRRARLPAGEVLDGPRRCRALEQLLHQRAVVQVWRGDPSRPLLLAPTTRWPRPQLRRRWRRARRSPRTSARLWPPLGPWTAPTAARADRLRVHAVGRATELEEAGRHARARAPRAAGRRVSASGAPPRPRHGRPGRGRRRDEKTRSRSARRAVAVFTPGLRRDTGHAQANDKLGDTPAPDGDAGGARSTRTGAPCAHWNGARRHGHRRHGPDEPAWRCDARSRTGTPCAQSGPTRSSGRRWDAAREHVLAARRLASR